ncbi:MAG: YhbY family RNA-binding protein, partial [Opitutaceae bacterium]|nr:YhbY family RNA-binding protein [Opitutaceae bacterium]
MQTELKGFQKAYLRGLGIKLQPHLKVGKKGLTPELLSELKYLFKHNELIKLKFGGDRDMMKTLLPQVAEETKSTLAGAVGRTALFYLENTDPEVQSLALP